MLLSRAYINTCSFLVVAALSQPAAASIIFNSLNGTNTYGYSSVGFDATNDNTYATGFAFVVPSGNDYRFTGGSLIAAFGTGVNSFNLTLYSDSSDSPGPALSTINLTDALPLSATPVPLSTTIAPTSFVSTLQPTLTGGDQYWLVASMTDPSSSTAYWWETFPSDPGLITSSINGAPFIVGNLSLDAFEISGTPVPEPSETLPAALGFCLLTRAIKSRWAIFAQTPRIG